MLGDISIAQKVYLACGYTDMRKSIDGLAALVQSRFEMNPYEPALFIFCGRRCDRIKALLWEGLSEYSDKKAMDFSFYTSDLKAASSNGLVMKTS